MKISNKQNNRISNEGIRTGLNDRDIIQLNRDTNYDPKIQVFDDNTIDGPMEQRNYYCANDKSLLTYLNGSDTVWYCHECLTYYDTKINDSPLRDVNEFKLVPYTDLQHYPTYDEDDPNFTFIEAINFSELDTEALESREPDNQRVQTINLRNTSFTEALLKGALTSKTRAQQQEEDE